MGAGNDDVLRTGVAQNTNGTCDGSAGVDHVVEQDTGAAGDITDDTVSNNLVGNIHAAGLVDERQGSVAQNVGPLFGNLHAASIGGDHSNVVEAVVLLDVVRQDRHGVHVIDGAVEEALDLVGVQVDRHDAVGTSSVEQVGDQAGGNRLAAAVLLVLAGVGVERQDRGDALGGAALQGVDHDELFHQPLVQRLGVGLQDEGVAAADGFFETDEDLAVGEVPCGHGGEVDAKVLGDGFTEFGVCAP